MPFRRRETDPTKSKIEQCLLTEIPKQSLRSFDAPILVCFQSSGWGKTKLGFSLRERKLAYVIYLNLGFLEGLKNGWPRPSRPFSLLEKVFPQDDPDTQDFTSVVQTVEKFICLVLQQSLQKFQQGDPSQTQTEVFHFDVESSSYAEELLQLKMEDLQKINVIETLREAKVLMDKIGYPVVFVWDEAAGMSTPKLFVRDDRESQDSELRVKVYRISHRPVFRQACRSIGLYLQDSLGYENQPVLHLLLSTFSASRNIQRPMNDISDDSLRFLQDMGKQRDPLTGLLENLDIQNLGVSQPLEDGVSTRDGNLFRSDGEVVKNYGRPLWSTCKPNPVSTVSMGLGMFAGSKLLGGISANNYVSANSFANSLTTEVILSLTYSRICGYFIPLQDAETLVRSHILNDRGDSFSHIFQDLWVFHSSSGYRDSGPFYMATAVGVTDNGQIQSTYFPEPSLAAGSQYVCDELGGYGSADMVKQLSKIIRSNPSNPGDVGEVATCMILLKVMDKLHRPVRDDPSEESSPKFPIVSVSQFLDTLLGESYNDIEQFKKVFNDLGGKIDWDNLVISFNHFFRAEFPEGDRGPEWVLRLRSAYDRCGAIIAD
eukprot:CAMPEP_0184326670 /NCGR_PEP_ID=MMETSP1049-20130417/142677_1 /TAXON_ID=77928 /ORGANISM="Proteomonas sulcata, Strain CCMP704" /LENGTH=599 /DNA_ID=CAMNT_0026648873 /DNA_START=2466 /DNA_END=4263 /DNA_ORIENTATION=+